MNLPSAHPVEALGLLLQQWVDTTFPEQTRDSDALTTIRRTLLHASLGHGGSGI